MTTPAERIRAVNSARTFLCDLSDPKKTPGVPLSVRKEARAVLRHYPMEADYVQGEDYPTSCTKAFTAGTSDLRWTCVVAPAKVARRATSKKGKK